MNRMKWFVAAPIVLAALALSACDKPIAAGKGFDVTSDPSLTGTPSASQTQEATETPEATEDSGTRAGCPGNSGSFPPPLAALATEFKVTNADIQNYWCQGFGVGEIRIALQLAKDTGKDPQSIFDMKKQGQGWGQIEQELGVKPGKGQEKGNHGKGKGNGNGGGQDDATEAP